jgi:hypothetical protein
MPPTKATERSFSSHTGFKVRELATGLKKTGLGMQMEHSEGGHDEAQSVPSASRCLLGKT